MMKMTSWKPSSYENVDESTNDSPMTVIVESLVESILYNEHYPKVDNSEHDGNDNKFFCLTEQLNGKDFLLPYKSLSGTNF